MGIKKTIENPRVVIVEGRGNVEIYRPSGNALEINGESYTDEKIYEMNARRKAIRLMSFSGEIGIPRGCVTKVTGWDGNVSGFISGPCYIESEGVVEAAVPEEMGLLVVSRRIRVDDSDVVTQYHEEKDFDYYESVEGLFREFWEKRIAYPLDPPQIKRVNGQMRLVGSLGQLPTWLKDDIVLADSHKIACIEAYRANLTTYRDDSRSSKPTDIIEDASLYNYALSCLQGIQLEAMGERASNRDPREDVIEKGDIQPEPTEEGTQSDSITEPETSRRAENTRSLWKRFLGIG